MSDNSEASLIAKRWIILLILFLARTAMAYQFQTVGALGPILVDAFKIDFAWLGILIGLYMLPGTVFALPGGLLGQRYGSKNVVLFGLLLMTIGGALTAVDVFAITASGRMISGIGAVLINVIMTRMVTDWFAGREIVTAMSIFIASWPLGLALGLISFPVIAAAWSWTAAMRVAALAAFICLIFLALIYRDPPTSQAGTRSTFRIAMTGHEWLLISLAGLIWCTYNVGYIVLISFLPEFFTGRGYSLAEASQIVSLLGWVLIPSVPLSGFIAERLNRPNLLMVIGFCTVAVAASVLPFTSTPVAVFTWVVIGIGLPAGLIMALPAQSVQPENRSIGMGIYYTFYYVGMALLPGLAGLVRDLAGSPAVTALFASAMMGVALIGLFGFRTAQRRV
jgi:predicted MFS family arabinose efflux permease